MKHKYILVGINKLKYFAFSHVDSKKVLLSDKVAQQVAFFLSAIVVVRCKVEKLSFVSSSPSGVNLHAGE